MSVGRNYIASAETFAAQHIMELNEGICKLNSAYLECRTFKCLTVDTIGVSTLRMDDFDAGFLEGLWLNSR